MTSQPTLSSKATISIVQDQVSCKLESETVILIPTTGKYLKLNRIGSRIWELLETPQQITKLLSKLQSEFKVDTITCEKETLAFIEALLQKRIIRIQS